MIVPVHIRRAQWARAHQGDRARAAIVREASSSAPGFAWLGWLAAAVGLNCRTARASRPRG